MGNIFIVESSFYHLFILTPSLLKDKINNFTNLVIPWKYGFLFELYLLFRQCIIESLDKNDR